MIDFDYRIQQSVHQERLQRALAKAECERIWERPPQPALYRRTLARVGAALVTTGTWLQRGVSPEPSSQFNPVRNH